MIWYFYCCAQKKLSIPNTVAKVLNYVPELQRQVERLERRKEEIIARTRSCQDLDGRSSGGGYPLVSVADLGSGELAIQICALSMAGRKGMMSAVMEYLDSEGLFTVHASTLAVDSSRILLNLHCQVCSFVFINTSADDELYLIFVVAVEECFGEVGSREAED